MHGYDGSVCSAADLLRNMTVVATANRWASAVLSTLPPILWDRWACPHPSIGNTGNDSENAPPASEEMPRS